VLKVHRVPRCGIVPKLYCDEECIPEILRTVDIIKLLDCAFTFLDKWTYAIVATTLDLPLFQVAIAPNIFLFQEILRDAYKHRHPTITRYLCTKLNA
jgi:hypothetical protein